MIAKIIYKQVLYIDKKKKILKNKAFKNAYLRNGLLEQKCAKLSLCIFGPRSILYAGANLTAIQRKVKFFRNMRILEEKNCPS